jgi:4-deoxy-L-threo-5-hexosulose-uronate ketol-isomerase
MTIEIRQASHPEAVRAYDTAALRRHFLITDLFHPGAVSLTLSHVDRVIVGGAMPGKEPLSLPNPQAVGQKTFLAKRELGICNVGGPGTVTCDREAFPLAGRDMLYVAMGTEDIVFASDDPANPAKFYLYSAPAHHRFKTVLVREAEANALELGSSENANQRILRQYILPGRVESCQIVMGLTTMKPGGVWNTMPAHTHDRRSEAYLYFGLPEGQRVFHFMGEPSETRHLLVANEQAILSPGWSIHSGCGTASYSFIWAMAGDNQDFTDMDMIAIGDLR